MASCTNDISTLIKEVEAKYLYSTDKSNYGQILSGVASRNNVHDIIRDIVTIADGISKSPYNRSDSKKFLYGYMNKCIVDLYERKRETSIEGFCEAYVNIREHENSVATRLRIVQIANNIGLDVEKIKNDIQKTFDEFVQNYKMLQQFTYNSNGYNQYLPLCKKGALQLLNYKFDPYGLPYGIGWSSNIFTEVKNDQQKAREEEKARLKKANEKKQENLFLIIGVAIIIVIIIGLSIWMESFEGGLILFIIIFAIIKLYAGFFK